MGATDDASGSEPQKFDLEERTAVFGETVIEFALAVTQNPVTTPLITQVVRSATSVGANYCEANDAVSKKEFRVKIGTCRKESKETQSWLRMIAKAAPPMKTKARPLWQEARELNLIFSKIFRSS